ncbi:uncharacterized protein B0I36DRAFT_323418 [Microdochium trichocladiopsis]|uniref:RING-type domain-containing protein n=1 Tax=Microdochium trichocladiopsis TaxID=1682393 RepID=A0A9P8Y4U1_9PEZI|nr:uncharacterized protein B0I36DRAFT_323418 [Microdochium trichocladiopsis]KAH7031207.1 hypothetical protein B0I36DRAFT_323418 [Microdochium trichocladiopsis]
MFSFLGSGIGRKSSSRSLKQTGPTTQDGSGSPLPSPPLASAGTLPPNYISDESQLQPPGPLPTHLADLNHSLEVLATIFPDVQVEVFREMLASFSEESRLALVTDLLLKSPNQYIRGRRIAPRPSGSRSTAMNTATTAEEPARDSTWAKAVPRKEAFRDDAYKEAVRALAAQEFKGLSRSSVQAVLSEYNYSYLDARPTLVVLSSKSWKCTISSLFYMRKPTTPKDATQHPLVIWRSTGMGSIFPMIKSTGNPELDRELFNELIAPLQQQERGKREASDHAMAVTLHTEEATACDALYECACCFTESTFEEFTTCNTDEGHMVCFQCVQHSINEALFGQGWQRSINKETGTLHCPAVSSAECQGHIVSDDIFRAVSQQKNGAEIMHKLDQRLADHGLVASGIKLVHCPFCSYAEADDIYVPAGVDKLKLKASNFPNVVFMILLPFCILPLFYVLAVVFLVVAFPYLSRRARHYLNRQLRGAVRRFQRRRRGLKFKCQNPTCARESCLSCSKAWVDIHVCHESSLVALRVQVEQAMAMAVKRVCPRCNTSFVKNGGCNKLTCPCGYKMCYVCRKDIGKSTEGYQHFCQHFRAQGDGRQCVECNKCNLWEQEDTAAILRQAKDEAERKWLQTEKRELSDAEKAYLRDVVRGDDSSASSPWSAFSPRAVKEHLFPGLRRVHSVADLFDLVFEAVFA